MGTRFPPHLEPSRTSPEGVKGSSNGGKSVEIQRMASNTDPSPSFETAISQWIHLVGVGIEIFGVFIIVTGIIWSSRYLICVSASSTSRRDSYKISIGRSLLLGLEVLVAADIVKTIAKELTFASFGLLAGLVLYAPS